MPDRDKILRLGSALIVLPHNSYDEIFLMTLALVSSLPIVFGKQPAPGSIDATMPSMMVFIWALTLSLGALTVLISLMLRDRITGMIVEQFGSVCIGVAASLYALAIFLTSYNRGGALPAGIIFSFAVTRFLQVRYYQKTLNKISRVRAQLLVEEKGYGD